MSPMCWLSQAYLLSATARVFFRSRADGQRRRHRHRKCHRQRRIAARPPDRAVRRRRRTRTTESSHGTRMARSCISQPSARCESRSTASSSVKQIGSPPRLPDVITRSGRSRLVARQPEQQCVQRGVGQHHAEIRVVRRDRVGDGSGGQPRHQHDGSLRTGQHPRRRRRRSPAMRCAVARSGTMTANGLSPRRFRRRSSATARSLAASQARW